MENNNFHDLRNTYIDLRNMPSIELLNFEGPVLKAIKAPFGCVVVDQWDKTVAICNKEQLQDFLSGKTNITDSNNKIWHYPAEHEGAKSSTSKLNAFINTMTI